MHSDNTKLYPGRLSDGASAASRSVVVRLARRGIEIDQGHDLPVLLWKYDTLGAGTPITARSADILVTNSGQPGATLYVDAPKFAQSLAAAAPGASAKQWRLAGLKPAAGITAVVLAFAGAIAVSGFSPSKTIAGLIPENARTLLGQRVVASMVGKYRVCSTKQGNVALARMMKKLSDAAGVEKPFNVLVVNWGVVNAFAAPGGQLVLTRGLIKNASSPDTVAGVMAHEMGHGIERHPEAGLVRIVGLSAAAEFFFTGSASSLKNIGLILTTLSYSRKAEREADAHALAILQKAGISAKPLAQFFGKLGKKQRRSSIGRAMGKVPILASHPPSPERAKMFGAAPAYAVRPAISAADWRALRGICGKSRKRKRLSPKARKKQRIAAAKRSIDTMSKRIDANPKDAAAFRFRAAAYDRLKQREKAIADLSKVIALEPDKAVNYANRGARYKVQKRWDQAIADYGEAVRLKPENIIYRRARGRLYMEKSDWDAAIAEFSEAIRLAPTYVSGYFGRAKAKRGKGDMSGALDDLGLAVENSPKSARAYLERGRMLREMGRADEAFADFNKAVSLSSRYLEARVARGQAYERRGQRDKAIRDYRKALSQRAFSTKTRRAKAKARERLRALGVSVRRPRRTVRRRPPSSNGRFKRQIESATDRIGANPQDHAAYRSRAFAYSKTGKNKEALKDYTAAIKLRPDDANSYSARARLFTKMRNWHAVIADLDRAIELKPDRSGAYMMRGRAFVKLGSDAEAMSDFTKAISLYAKDAQAFMERGKLFAAKGQRDRAIADFTAAISVNDRVLETYYLRGLLLEQNGQPKRAIADYRKAVSLSAFGSDDTLIQAKARKRLQELTAIAK